MNPNQLIRRLRKFESCYIVGRLRKAIQFTDEPKFPQWFCEPSPSRKRILEEQYGSSLSLNEQTAKIKSIAEAIERYCSETIDKKKIIWSSYEKLNEKAVDPIEFINYSSKILKNRREEYIEKIRKAKMTWVNGKHLNSNKAVLIPAQLVYSPFDVSKEPLIRTPISTGAAFHTNKDSALENGLLEIIERDSFMLSWLTKSNPSIINLNSKFKNLKEYFERYLLEPYVFDITSDLNIPVMMGLILDRTGVGPAVSMGLKSSLDSDKAILGSLLEAQHVRGWIRFSFLKENKPTIKDSREIVDLKTRGYYWYPIETIKKLDFLLDSPKTKNIQKKKDILKGKSLSQYLMDHGFDIYSVDISTPEVKNEGFVTLKTIVPKLHPLSLDEDMPYDFSERLNRYDIKDINKIPHPFL